MRKEEVIREIRTTRKFLLTTRKKKKLEFTAVGKEEIRSSELRYWG